MFVWGHGFIATVNLGTAYPSIRTRSTTGVAAATSSCTFSTTRPKKLFSSSSFFCNIQSTSRECKSRDMDWDHRGYLAAHPGKMASPWRPKSCTTMKKEKRKNDPGP